MSEPTGPVRRRRIAGESGPAAPAVRKAAPKKSVGKTPAKAASNAPAMAPSKTPVKAPVKAPVRPPVKAPWAKVTTAPPVAVRVPTPAREQDAPARADKPTVSRPSRRDVLWLVPATLIAIAALMIGSFLVLNPPGSDDGDLDASRRQASSAAASAAETIFSFRFDQLDQHLAASKAIMTPAFAKDFDKIAPALTELAPQRKIVVEAVARESAVLPCGDDCSATAADVLVFVDQARLVGDSTEPTVFANRIKVSMVKNDRGWVVSNIRAL